MSSESDVDLYIILGVARSSTGVEIKAAYRRLALEHHPDRTGGDHAAEEKLKAVITAYNILRDAERRLLYDEFGSLSLRKGFDPVAARNREHASVERTPLDGIHDGLDFHANLVLTHGEAWRGAARAVEYRRWRQCDDCNGLGQLDEACWRCSGTGLQSMQNVQACPTCFGHGALRSSNWPFYLVTCHTCDGGGQLDYGLVSMSCDACNGIGQVAIQCSTCKGQAVVCENASVTVKIPARTKDGITLRLAGEGTRTLDGRVGDVLLHVRIAA